MSSSTGSGPDVRAGAGAGPATGAGSRVEHRKRKPWWLWALLALVALALLAFGLSQCGPGAAGPVPNTADGGAPSAAPAGAPTGQAGPAAGAGAAAGAAAGALAPDALTADGEPMLPVSEVAGDNGSLAGLVGKPVTANGVTVQSVPANEGFWVGTGEADRVWVQLTGGGESGYVVKQGDRVQFSGTMVNHDGGFAGQAGVDPAEGADQLTAQAAHAEVQKSTLRQSD
jgi:hypothetical protein